MKTREVVTRILTVGLVLAATAGTPKVSAQNNSESSHRKPVPARSVPSSDTSKHNLTFTSDSNLSSLDCLAPLVQYTDSDLVVTTKVCTDTDLNDKPIVTVTTCTDTSDTDTCQGEVINETVPSTMDNFPYEGMIANDIIPRGESGWVISGTQGTNDNPIFVSARDSMSDSIQSTSVVGSLPGEVPLGIVSGQPDKSWTDLVSFDPKKPSDISAIECLHEPSSDTDKLVCTESEIPKPDFAVSVPTQVKAGDLFSITGTITNQDVGPNLYQKDAICIEYPPGLTTDIKELPELTSLSQPLHGRFYAPNELNGDTICHTVLVPPEVQKLNLLAEQSIVNWGKSAFTIGLNGIETTHDITSIAPFRSRLPRVTNPDRQQQQQLWEEIQQSHQDQYQNLANQAKQQPPVKTH
jgi:hypothetical protein